MPRNCVRDASTGRRQALYFPSAVWRFAVVDHPDVEDFVLDWQPAPVDPKRQPTWLSNTGTLMPQLLLKLSENVIGSKRWIDVALELQLEGNRFLGSRRYSRG